MDLQQGIGIGIRVSVEHYDALIVLVRADSYFPLKSDPKGGPLQYVSPKNIIKVKPAQKSY